MSERELQPEIVAEQKECLFDEGLEKIMSKIDLLLSTQDGVVIAISGPLGNDINVGKTALANKIEAELLRQGIPVIGTSDIDMLNEYTVRNIRKMQEEKKSSKFAIVFDAEGISSGGLSPEKQEEYKTVTDESLQRKADLVGLPPLKIDIRILIYRPDRPIDEDEKQMADIVVRNEGAKDKPKY